MTRYLLPPLALLLMLVPVSASADAFLEQLAGSWTGKGWARAEPDAAKEAVRCRISNRIQGRTGALFVNGKCATAGKSFKINGQLQSVSGGTAYTGNWTNPNGIGGITVNGKRRGQTVTLSFRTKLPETGEHFSGQISWTVAQSKVTLSTRGTFATSGKSGRLSQISFRKR
ncbi:hypothetical protein [Coralliovum pocilloporae]|uniref:hypothetical protein n=1 Tax=Coralliovum pocilloporae TaxID=3066369 RepID=UPI003307788C